MNTFARMLLCCAAAAMPAQVQAQSFPERPIRFIVPFPPGGGTDTFARAVGAKLTQAWSQQIIIDNRGGAQGNIGTALGAKAAPDGYTITLAFVGTLAINPHLYSNPGFDTRRDFTAVSRGTDENWLLVIHPSVGVSSVKDLAALAKQQPGKLTYASPSSAGQLLAELFKLTTGTDILHIPYKGAGPATIDLVAGNVHMMFPNPTGPMPHIKSGRLRALMVIGPKRFDELPDVPAAAEAGFPELNLTGWYGIVAPAATPRAIVAKLNAGVVDALKSADLVKRMRAAGQHPSPSTSDEFNQQIRTDLERWAKIVKATGTKVE
ncbi:MAG: tripartite tricarboxylate transporter substrate binding protein [Burkholderiales bacterium]|nr:tripartite tricarboxylate transporter substrate binding protein [Burkholderiales bacterium]